jgi:hypothetical protein
MQALALRSAAHHACWWILVNALGWAVALPIIYVAASNDGGLSGSAVIDAIGAGAVAGLCLGVITGLGFWRITPR